jgi:hypothetical protein
MKFISNYFSRFKNTLLLGGVKEHAKKLQGLAKDIKNIDNSGDENANCDSFDDLSKLGITEEKLQKAKKTCYKMSIFSLIIGIFLILYLTLCIIKMYYMSCIIIFLLAMVLFGLAFRYHFWYMQVTKRRLGCTFGDWVNFLFSKDSN